MLRYFIETKIRDHKVLFGFLLTFFCIGLLIFFLIGGRGVSKDNNFCYDLKNDYGFGSCIQPFKYSKQYMDSLTNERLCKYNIIRTYICSKKSNIDSLYLSTLASSVCRFSDKFVLISPSLLVSLMYYESCFDTLALSYAGARGIMQIMPSTAQWTVTTFNLKSDYNLYSLEDNMEIGCFYLDYLISKYGEDNALSIYNSGSVSSIGKMYANHIYKLMAEM